MYDWAFTQQGLGFVSSDGIMYQPQPIAGKNYKNAILNLNFRTEILDNYFVNGISRVSMVGKVGSNKDVVVDNDINDVYLAESLLSDLVNKSLPSEVPILTMRN